MSKTKWTIEPYDSKGYLTVHNFDSVIKESLNCLNELHRTKTLCNYEQEIFPFDITDTQTGVNQGMDIEIWFDVDEPDTIHCEIVNAFSEHGCWTRGNDYQSLWTVHKDNVQEFLKFFETKSDAISDNNEPLQEEIYV
ncbi:MAG: hypothetical protein CL761_04650 [Chloroflexi bacterium]|nr:hypothetical protein [Chloroflexota bacterium]|tara:strand:+ start:393 stop:806 length:414 start_codon:yes stop_codon:yes gene_type:complete